MAEAFSVAVTRAALGLGLTLALMGACAEEADVEDPAPTGGAEVERPTPPEEPPAEPEPAEPVLDPETVCGQARACCEAFAAAIPNVVVRSACRGPIDASADADADARCEAMRAGWREALALHSAAEPPPECGAPD